MSVATVSQTIASQSEHLSEDMERLYILTAPFWKRMKKDTQVQAISNRPARVPYEVLQGGKFRTGNLDGADLGRGSGPVQAYGELSCVTYIQASEYTALSDYATDSSEKAIKSYVTLTQQRAAETMGQYMDAVAVYGDGGNTLDTVVSTTTNGIVVNNANKFGDNQDIDVWSALGGTFRGSVTINSSDISSNTIWTVGALPAGTTAGDLLLVSGSAGVQNTGLYGLLYYHATGNTGNYQGIQKSAFQGKYSVPNINLNSAALTPAAVRAVEAQIRLAIGSDEADRNEVFAHCGVDMQAAWENTALNVQHVIANEVKGDQATDMLKRKAPTLIAGRELVPNERATPGRIDFVSEKHWSRVETKALDFYEVGGQTVFPTYGASGGVNSTIVFYYVTMVQLNQNAPRTDASMTSIAIPHYYFGK